MINIWRHIPSFKGKKRLIRAFHGKHIKKSRNIIFQCRYNLVFIVPNLAENISFDLFFEGIYEEKLVEFIIKSLPLNGIFIDVGANIGAISLVVAKRRPDISVYAIEASPHVFAYLHRNIAQNELKNIHAWNLAAHNENDLELDFFAPNDKFGKGSLVNVFDCVSEKVKTIRMDHFFRLHNIKPDLIKVDVEGFEAMIFESMGDYLISKPQPQIVFEFVDWAERSTNIFSIGDAQKILLNHRYQLYLLNEYSSGLRKSINTPLEIGSFEIIAIPIKENGKSKKFGI